MLNGDASFIQLLYVRPCIISSVIKKTSATYTCTCCIIQGCSSLQAATGNYFQILKQAPIYLSTCSYICAQMTDDFLVFRFQFQNYYSISCQYQYLNREMYTERCPFVGTGHWTSCMYVNIQIQYIQYIVIVVYHTQCSA